jgi:hypothetical protein
MGMSVPARFCLGLATAMVLFAYAVNLNKEKGDCQAW